MSDNGKCSVGEEFRVLCEKYRITHFFTSVGHPQTGRLIERANRIILNILKPIFHWKWGSRWVPNANEIYDLLDIFRAVRKHIKE